MEYLDPEKSARVLRSAAEWAAKYDAEELQRGEGLREARRLLNDLDRPRTSRGFGATKTGRDCLFEMVRMRLSTWRTKGELLGWQAIAESMTARGYTAPCGGPLTRHGVLKLVRACEYVLAIPEYEHRKMSGPEKEQYSKAVEECYERIQVKPFDSRRFL